MSDALWGLPAAALAVVFLVTLIPVIRRIGLLDQPNERSMHAVPVVRGAGLALIAAFLVAVYISGNRAGHASGALYMSVAAATLLGFADDIRSIRVPYRLGALVAISLFATLYVTTADARIPVAIGATLWIVGFTNSFNFMDGINGISTLTTLIMGIGWVFVGDDIHSPLVITSSAALVGVSAVFLPFNFPAGKVFLGDAGSYGLGTIVSTIVVLSVREGAPLLMVGLPCMLYLFDTVTTVVDRAIKHEQILKAHRGHAYQRMALRIGQTPAALLVAAITAVLTALMVIGIDSSTAVRWAFLAVGAALCAVFVLIPRAAHWQSSP